MTPKVLSVIHQEEKKYYMIANKKNPTYFVIGETVIKTETIIKSNLSRSLRVQPPKVGPSLILCGEILYGEILCGEKLLTNFSQDWDLVLESRKASTSLLR